MPRVLSTKPNAARFFDNISDSYLILYYRNPTTEERIAYTNALLTRRGQKIESAMGEARLKYGLRILIGIRDGDFATDDGPMSSNQQSPGYKENWKAIINELAPDVIAQLAILVFENPLVSAPEDENVANENPL
ncbi:MAG: hypothetical protein UY48_C0010G0004 [Candidatus Gottesmanbacteria bacterium GW2011_GWB1_49_7]|uniref:Uncharacterized protein n=1 Tax=Candidatus Gottesmanbacteria bacterium GW2011_GWB1_49_7 TaxID=1618448 RepID=A0A0G1YCH1_9BACT|nr:MAG: hypothetical protein UY48_C0010G0004 [Candidatus Gottesmanbacteria bacterium GW2011_GWB1_49_7]